MLKGKRTVTEYETHLFQDGSYQELLGRVGQLSPASQRRWGQMDVAQMLAHVALSLDESMSSKPASQTMLGRVFGSYVKRKMLSGGLSKNMPTDPPFKVTDQRQFQQEQEAVQLQLRRFFEGAENGATRQPHHFFGRMTPQEWARLNYVHLDHHLKQFGA